MCCGNKRRQLRAGTPADRNSHARKAPAYREPKRHAQAYFQYLGQRGIIVTGPVSGRQYRFESFGAVAAVDPRDRRSLRMVSDLQQVRAPA